MFIKGHVSEMLDYQRNACKTWKPHNQNPQCFVWCLRGRPACRLAVMHTCGLDLWRPCLYTQLFNMFFPPSDLPFSHLKTGVGVWRDGSAVETTCCSLVPRISFQHSPDSLQPPLTLVAGDLMSSSVLHQHQARVWLTDIPAGKKLINVK